MPLKVCHITNGQTGHLFPWIESCRRAGYEIHLVTPEGPGIEPTGELRGVRIHCLRTSRSRPIRFALQLLQLKLSHLIEKIQPDVVHSHQVVPYGFYGALCGVHPHLMTAFGSDVLVEAQRSRIKRALAAYACRSSDAYTADSSELIRALSALGADGRRCHTIHRGVDLKLFTPSVNRRAAKQALGLDPDVPAILSPRLLMPNYNVDVIIRSIPLVRKKIPRVMFLIKFWYGELYQGLKELASALGVGDAVRFDGYIPYQQMPLYYQAADVCVSIPSSDASGRANFEAMACGAPLLVSELPWLQDFKQEHFGVSFFRLPKISPDALAEALIDLLENDVLRLKLMEGNLAFVRKHMDQEIWLEKMQAVYEQLRRPSAPGAQPWVNPPKNVFG